MEIRTTIHITRHLVRLCIVVLFIVVVPVCLSAQPAVKSYNVKNGKMYITLGKNIKDASLDSFIRQFSLNELALKQLIKNNVQDSLAKHGWQVNINNDKLVVLSKPMMTFNDVSDPITRLIDTYLPVLKGSEVYQSLYGYNKFKNKHPFIVTDESVTFYLRNNANARQVKLAGSFTRWQTNAVSMVKTDSGWITTVKLRPGKYWYKFIIDDNWTIDIDNLIRESDGRGNINSVYYKTNVNFSLSAFPRAKKVYLAGSFNKWQEKEILMNRTASGWQLPMYLNEGTHTYKFVVDGQWYYEEKKQARLPDGVGGYNSVVTIGDPHLFKLNGFTNAKRVFLSGSFNDWRGDELEMNRTASGWELPYVIGPGNYEYKFVVDGKWIADPANPLKSPGEGNSFIVIKPNYTFRLAGYNNAKSVYLAGDFNNWQPNTLPMRHVGNEWTFDVYLPIGKHSYKFFVDGEWIKDPANKLWEQNEYGTGNSIVWIENDAFSQ